MNEIWKPIPGYEGIYEASNLGRVRCWLIRFGRKIKAKLDIPVILKTYSTWGYSIVELSDWTGKRKMRRLHRIILLTFVGPCPPDHEGFQKQNQSTGNYSDGEYTEDYTTRHELLEKALSTPAGTAILRELEQLREKV